MMGEKMFIVMFTVTNIVAAEVAITHHLVVVIYVRLVLVRVVLAARLDPLSQHVQNLLLRGNVVVVVTYVRYGVVLGARHLLNQ